MSEKNHTLAIGAFVLGAMLITLVTALFLLGTGLQRKDKVVMVFDDSVKGLNVGAPLALRGVQVGQVSKVEAILDADKVELIMLVEADFFPDRIRLTGSTNDNLAEELLARGLRAQLNTLSLLTGLLYVQLDFHPGSELKLARIDSPHFQFPTIPNNLELLARRLEDLDVAAMTNELRVIGEGIRTLVESEEFQDLPANLNTTLLSFGELSEQLQQQLDSSGPRLDTLLDEAATTLDSANAELPELLDLVQQNLQTLEEAIVAFERTMGGIESLVSQDSATVFEINRTLREVNNASRSLQALARTLEEQPEALLRGRREQQ